jgi:glycosyltransferase involved in cell wall biosynthesis
MGDGPERERLHGLAQKLGITKSVEFTGAVSPERVADELAQAEVFVLTSNTEGWPKAIAEAMAFGLICVGSDLGLIRTFLAEGRGFTVPPRDAGALCDRLIQIANSGPGERQAMSEKAATWAQGYSLDSLQTALAGVMRQWWRLPAPPTPPQAPVQEAQ